MVLNLSLPPQVHPDFQPRIAVIGVGGAGCNAVNNMIALDLEGCDFIVANTDAQTLAASRAERRIQLGPHLTQGLGAGGKPEIGRAAAEEAADDILEQIDGAHMIFVTAGMGGGTGTGAAPVIARLARERGILTVGVVSKPFEFEGRKRKTAADEGIEALQGNVDTLIVIPNQNLFRLANDRTTFQEALKLSDNVLYMGVRGVTDLIVNPGLVNLDFADIRSVMGEMGKAMMGTGECEGEARSVRAAEAAIQNPLLEDTSMKGARAVLINITGGFDMTLHEVDAAAKRIKDEVEEDANIIFGTALDEGMTGRIRVSVVATGLQTETARAAAPQPEVQPTRNPAGRVQMLRPVPPAIAAAATAASPAAAAAAQPAPALATAAGPAPIAEPAPVDPPPAAAVAARAEPARSPDLFPPAQQPMPAAPPAWQPAPAAASAAPQGLQQLARSAPGALLRRVTGLMGSIRHQADAAPLPQAVAAELPARVEPLLVEPAHAPVSRSRIAPAEDSGLDIPAFLRRQAN